MAALITIQFCTPAGYQPGDYAYLYGNGGAGEINWDTPVDNTIYDLFPRGAGIYGFGHAPFGHHRFGKGVSLRTAGFGHLPFGKHPFGHGTAIITTQARVEDCGSYKFGFKVFDKYGNAQEGTSQVVTADIHIPPVVPGGLKKVSYDKDTDILILEAA